MFTHLHLHTQYSLLDGAAKIDDVIKRAKEDNMSSVAITDHGVMYGVVDFYLKAKEEGIKPIIGCEVYTAATKRSNKVYGIDNKFGHLVLLAKNNTGYVNLMKISSIAFTEGYYYKPRVDFEVLEKHSEGLIALSACLFGDVNNALLKGDLKKAEEYALKYKNIFGDDFYLEIQNHNLEDEKRLIPLVLNLSQKLDIPIVATNDVHYIKKEDSYMHDVLLCIQTGKKIDDDDRMKFSNDEFYFKSQSEMATLFKDYPSAIENTQKIADMCNVDISFDNIYLPKINPENGLDSKEYLEKLCNNALNKRYENITEEITDRLKSELEVINQMGFADYFLIVYDYVSYAKKSNIAVGPGRGSAAGSIVAYLLEITDVDPIKYGLLFERFLNPERVSMPDIDIDFCYVRRDEMIEYMVKKYGSDYAAQIVTFDTLLARGSIRDVGRVLDLPIPFVDKIAKMIPRALGMTIDIAMEENPDLKVAYNADNRARTLIDMAKKLEGLPKNVAKHAAGVVVTDKKLYNYVPVMEGDIAYKTQYHMKVLEKLGVVKMDFLGLRNLTIINDTIDLINKNNNEIFSIENIDYEDENVYKMLSLGDTSGVFQLESEGMTSFLRDLKPNTFEDIIAGLSLYRPATAKIQIPLFLKNRKDNSKIAYKHPLLEPILKPTYGSIVYQEQAMQIFRSLAGYSLGRADLVRRAMAKKNHKALADERNIFINGLYDDNGNKIIKGTLENGLSIKLSEEIFDELAEFSNYAFNKSHATAYAKIVYQTAYLKRYYPAFYLVSLLKNNFGMSEKQAKYIDDFSKYGIKILPPDVNQSCADFTVNGNNIRFSLSSIKNVGTVFAKEIEEKRKIKKHFTSFTDFCNTMKDSINKKSVENLIKCGAFDSINPNRKVLLINCDDVVDKAQRSARNVALGQFNMFDMSEEFKDLSDNFCDELDFSKAEKLMAEKELTGLYFSGHPLDNYKEKMKAFSNVEIMDITEEKFKDGKEVTVCGMITKITRKKTQKGDVMANVIIEDFHSSCEMVVFPNVLSRFENVIQEGKIVVVNAGVSFDYNDKLNLMVKNIYDIEKVSYPKNLAVYIKIKTEAEFEKVKKLISKYKGMNKLVIFVEDKNKVFNASEDNFVNLTDEFLYEAKYIFGYDNVKIK
ncbi:MAG: DNA polymerase III subunit alpha [Ruminococcaceae bacterium]|nr:DNA polymerase III subunit alpha [Oscillospiraceae bacterium]